MNTFACTMHTQALQTWKCLRLPLQHSLQPICITWQTKIPLIYNTVYVRYGLVQYGCTKWVIRRTSRTMVHTQASHQGPLILLQVGYKHFDKASLYKIEGSLEETLKEAMQASLVKRDDLFITSKLWSTDNYPKGVLLALKKSLRFWFSILNLFLILSSQHLNLFDVLLLKFSINSRSIHLFVFMHVWGVHILQKSAKNRPISF